MQLQYIVIFFNGGTNKYMQLQYIVIFFNGGILK